MDKKLQPKEDVRITKQASAFARNLVVKDYNPKALALFAYYEGRKEEFLAGQEARQAEQPISIPEWIEKNNPYTNPTAAAFWREGAEALAKKRSL